MSASTAMATIDQNTASWTDMPAMMRATITAIGKRKLMLTLIHPCAGPAWASP